MGDPCGPLSLTGEQANDRATACLARCKNPGLCSKSLAQGRLDSIGYISLCRKVWLRLEGSAVALPKSIYFPNLSPLSSPTLHISPHLKLFFSDFFSVFCSRLSKASLYSHSSKTLCFHIHTISLQMVSIVSQRIADPIPTALLQEDTYMQRILSRGLLLHTISLKRQVVLLPLYQSAGIKSSTLAALE